MIKIRNIEKIFEDKFNSVKWEIDSPKVDTLTWNLPSLGYATNYRIVGYYDFIENKTLYYGQFIVNGNFEAQVEPNCENLEDMKTLCYHDFVHRISRSLEITENDFEKEK